MWVRTVIDPHKREDFKISRTEIDPTGEVITRLMKRHVAFDDRGTYTCQDLEQSNSYSIWVTVLQCECQKIYY